MLEEVVRAATAVAGHGPVPLIFADSAALYLLDNWLWHAAATGMRQALLLALDEATAARTGDPHCRVVQLPFDGTLAELWQVRLLVFEALAAAGIDVVHSDLDAVWLDDPRPHLFDDAAIDAAFSQGTFHPRAAHDAWHFVLCCGLFGLRGRPATARFMAAVRGQAAHDGDDQAALNHVLLHTGTVWESDDAGETYRIGDEKLSFACRRRMLRGRNARFGLRIGLLPFHRVPRLVLPTAFTAERAIVCHPHSLRGEAGRVAALRAAGVWRDDAASARQARMP
jgi:hypothetical protein